MSREWDDGDSDIPLCLWEAALENALNGKRGQKFLQELEAEMLSMKERGEGRLLSGYLMADGTPINYAFFGEPKFQSAPVGVCTIGIMCKKKGVAKEWINREIETAHDYPSSLPRELGIANCMITEIGVMNDSGGGYVPIKETDEQRFDRMLNWVQKHISSNGERVLR